MSPVSDASTATDAAAGINIVTAGVFELCVVISPVSIPADAYLTVGEVEIEATPCEESPPADTDVLGDWSGTYTCTNFGTSDDVALPISLNIAKNQDGSYRYTDDGGAAYDGHFCGSSFRYKGGVANSYTESGLFIYLGAGSATKRSAWNSVPAGANGGSCFDDLTRN